MGYIYNQNSETVAVVEDHSVYEHSCNWALAIVVTKHNVYATVIIKYAVLQLFSIYATTVFYLSVYNYSCNKA